MCTKNNNALPLLCYKWIDLHGVQGLDGIWRCFILKIYSSVRAGQFNSRDHYVTYANCVWLERHR